MSVRLFDKITMVTKYVYCIVIYWYLFCEYNHLPSIMDTLGAWGSVLYTVEPLYCGHLGGLGKCPVYREVSSFQG